MFFQAIVLGELFSTSFTFKLFTLMNSFHGSSAFYTSDGFIIGRALYWEEFVLKLFIFDVFCQGIRPPGDKLRSQVTEA